VTFLSYLTVCLWELYECTMLMFHLKTQTLKLKSKPTLLCLHCVFRRRCAVALGYSQDMVDATRGRVIIITPPVTTNIREIISVGGGGGSYTRLKPSLNRGLAIRQKCKWKPKRGMDQSVRWGRMSRAFDLDRYTRALYMVVDVLVPGPMNSFFDDKQFVGMLDSAGVELVDGGMSEIPQAAVALVPPNTKSVALQVKSSGRFAVSRPDVKCNYRTHASLAVLNTLCWAGSLC
jgi:hypothetical protein